MFSLLKFADVILVKKWNLIVSILQYFCFIFVITNAEKAKLKRFLMLICLIWKMSRWYQFNKIYVTGNVV